jgi:hypothetical protein
MNRNYLLGLLTSAILLFVLLASIVSINVTRSQPSVTSTEIFTRNLVLRGIIAQVSGISGQYNYTYLLVRSGTPLPYVYGDNISVAGLSGLPLQYKKYHLEWCFVNQEYPQVAYEIQGQVTATLTLKLELTNGDDFDSAYVNGTYYFEKILMDDTAVTLASAPFGPYYASEYPPSAALMEHEGGFIFSFPTPINIGQFERLAVRVSFDVNVVDGTNPPGTPVQAKFTFCFTRNSNEFMLIVPIVCDQPFP